MTENATDSQPASPAFAPFEMKALIFRVNRPSDGDSSLKHGDVVPLNSELLEAFGLRCFDCVLDQRSAIRPGPAFLNQEIMRYAEPLIRSAMVLAVASIDEASRRL